MEFYERDFFISRIRAGYVPIKVYNKRVLIHQPTLEISLQASELYLNEYERATEEGLLKDSDILSFLIINDLWSDQKEKEYNEIVPKHIEYWKMELYKSSLKSKTKESIRQYLDTAKKELENLHYRRHKYDYLTREGYATYVKNMFIISKCAKVNNKHINWSKADLNLIMQKYHNSILDAEDVRLLSRTSPWSSLWNILKTNGKIFNNEILTSEQQSLISWSVMYDRIHESPDCPTDEVIDDDDMLDGWLLIQRKQRENERKKQEVEGSISSKVSGADEIFIVAETKEDAQKIDLLNTQQSNKIKQRRLKQIKEKGMVKEQELEDMKLRQAIQMRQEYSQKLKGG